MIPAAALPYVPYVALGAGALVIAIGFALAFRRKVQGRPVLLLGLVLAALPAVYVGLVWTRLMPESYIRFARPFLGLVAFPAMLFAALRLSGGAGRMGRARTVVSDLLVTLALLASAIAAAGPELGRPLDRLSVIIVIDRSRSIDLVPAAATRIERELVVAEEGMRDDDRIGTVVFGTNAAMEDPLRPKTEVSSPQRVDLGRDGTDIAAGLKRALAEMPADTAGRIVLMSDGVPTRGDVMAAAAAAVASEIPIDVVVLEQREVADIRIVSVRMTPRANEDEMLSMRVVVASPADAEIELRILRDGELVRRIPAKVAAGEDVLRIREPAPTAGLHRYDVELTAKNARLDESAEDNRASAFVRVRGPARALVLDGDPGKTTFMGHALREAGFRVDEGSTSSMPADIGGMATYDLIVFGDIPAKDLATRQLDALASYARDLGGGLLLTGGDRSFGPGGYGRTPVEEISPVLFDLKQERRRASLAEVIAIDISGSMAMRVGSQTKLELANEAASRSANLLGTGDQLGVVHVDTAPNWAVPLGPVSDKAAIEKAIRSVGPGGGGILVDIALNEAYAALRKVNVNLKHVLLFADGSDAENITPTVQSWVSSAASSGITTSCISLGRGHHSPLLEDLSRRGGGRFYIVEDATRLPAVFAQETILASRSAIVERPFRVAPVVGHSATEGIDFAAAPELDGYVVTIAKPRSSVLLTGPDDDPILATWPAGIGRTAAFTSDFKDRWGADWTHWQGAARTLVQIARHISRREDDGRVRLEADTAGGQMHLRATVVDDDGRLQSFRRLTASVRGPDGFEHDVPLEAAGAGSYTATVPLAQPGAYIAVARDDVNGQAVSTTGAVLTAGEEMRPTGSDTALLTRIADLSGGKRRDTIAGIFADRADLRFAYRDITLPLIVAAAFALLLAVAARRLSLPEKMFARAGARLAKPRAEGEAAPAADAKATLEHLLARQKDKTDERPAPLAESPQGVEPRRAEASGPVGGPVGPAPTPPPPAAAPTMAEQLAARRRAPRTPEPAQEPVASWSATGWQDRQPSPGSAPISPSTKGPAPTGGDPPAPSRPLTAAEILLQKRKGKR